ncbi:hypothetical protein BDW62DRAFT_90895 [Aspergillus aurantiobrunneus]
MHLLTMEKGKRCLVIGGHGIFSRHVIKSFSKRALEISTKLYTHMPGVKSGRLHHIEDGSLRRNAKQRDKDKGSATISKNPFGLFDNRFVRQTFLRKLGSLHVKKCEITSSNRFHFGLGFYIR